MHIIPETIYPIAQMGDEVLLVLKENLPYIGKKNALKVQCVFIDLMGRRIQDPIGIEYHLKFNPWEEITDDAKRTMIRKLIETRFSDSDILEKIVKPLEANKIS